MSAKDAFGCKDGQFRLEIQNDMPAQRLNICDRLEILGSPRPHNGEASRRSTKRIYARVWMRVGSNGKRKEPIWCVAPVILHRPWPNGALLKWAHLVRRHVGTHAKWELLLNFANSEGWGNEDSPQASDGARGD